MPYLHSKLKIIINFNRMQIILLMAILMEIVFQVQLNALKELLVFIQPIIQMKLINVKHNVQLE